MDLYEASVSVSPVDAEIGIEDEILLGSFFSSQEEAEEWLAEQLRITEIAQSGRIDRLAGIEPTEAVLLEILNTGSEPFIRERTRMPVAFFDVETERRALQIAPV